MPLDTSIPLQAKFAPINYEIQQPANTLMMAMKLKQLDQEGELNALTLKERTGLKEFMASKPDLKSEDTRYRLATEFGETGRKISEGVTNVSKAATEEAKRRNDLTVSKTAQYRDALMNVNDRNSALQWIETQQQDPDMAGSPVTQGSIMDAARKIPADPAGFEQWKQKAALGMGEYIKRNTMTAAESARNDKEAQRIRQEGQRIGLEGRRVAVLEEEAKQKKDPAFQQQMAQARATGEAIAKGDVAARQALPNILANAELAINNIDDMIGKQEVKDASGKVIQQATKPHKGFQNAVGATWLPGARFVPGTAASDFQALQDQVEGSAFLSAFEALKGGGAIATKEGEKATAAKLRMKLSQSEDEYIKAAREFQDIVRKGVENAKSKAGAGGTIQPSAGGANIDALLDKYK
jgi:hypothetical protein